MKRTTALLTGAAVMLTATVCSAIELKGTQIKGNAGRNAEIKSATVKLTKAAKIVKIEGGKAGLCIESPAQEPLCGEVKELIGKTLKPGSYTTYPNIPEGRESASVTIHLK